MTVQQAFCHHSIYSPSPLFWRSSYCLNNCLPNWGGGGGGTWDDADRATVLECKPWRFSRLLDGLLSMETSKAPGCACQDGTPSCCSCSAQRKWAEPLSSRSPASCTCLSGAFEAMRVSCGPPPCLPTIMESEIMQPEGLRKNFCMLLSREAERKGSQVGGPDPTVDTGEAQWARPFPIPTSMCFVWNIVFSSFFYYSPLSLRASASLEDAPHVVSAACVPPLTVTLHSCCIFNLPCGIWPRAS